MKTPQRPEPRICRAMTSTLHGSGRIAAWTWCTACASGIDSERERERHRQTDRQTDRKRERDCVCRYARAYVL